jgi:hypothetical protein
MRIPATTAPPAQRRERRGSSAAWCPPDGVAPRHSLWYAGGHGMRRSWRSAALDDIAFYQKCGFRMYAVKRDYFDDIQPPLREHGIVMRDMIVFAYDLDARRPAVRIAGSPRS